MRKATKINCTLYSEDYIKDFIYIISNRFPTETKIPKQKEQRTTTLSRNIIKQNRKSTPKPKIRITDLWYTHSRRARDYQIILLYSSKLN
jgi:hypothetical protein